MPRLRASPDDQVEVAVEELVNLASRPEAAALVAEASLAVYLLHWPVLDAVGSWPGVLVSGLAGVTAVLLVRQGRRRWRLLDRAGGRSVRGVPSTP